MKKFVMMIFIIAIMSGCATSADTESDVVYPSIDYQVNKLEPKPYIVEIEEETVALEEPWTETQNGLHNHPNGVSFISAKVKDGKKGKMIKKFAVAYNSQGEKLSRTELVDEVEVIETTPTIYADGQPVQPDAYYTSSRITRYGYDCYGCNYQNERGNTAAGIQIGNNEVRQKDGSWKTGITYEGYYIIATSQSIPMCTIVEISNHSIEGRGIKKGVPFKAIVLDRGGAITGSKIDLFVGSESDPAVSMGSKRTVDVKILDLNSRYKSGGMFNCGV